MAYNYCVTALKPTSVTHALTANFTALDSLNLVLAKATRLEIFEVTPSGLNPVLDVGLYGRISTIKVKYFMKIANTLISN